jgi:DNA polymerase III epsilon subunit-like protein
MLARQARITVIDFETTGVVRPLPSEPWQVGMVMFNAGKVIPETSFTSLLRVGDRPFSPHAPGRHAELHAEILQASTLTELWPTLRPWLTDRPLAAHNIGTEKKIIRQLAPFHRFGPWIDTLKLVRYAYPHLASHALEDILNELDLLDRVYAMCPGLEPHDALFDAFGSGVLLEHLLQLPGWDDVTVDDLAQAHPAKFHQLVLHRKKSNHR